MFKCLLKLAANNLNLNFRLIVFYFYFLFLYTSWFWLSLYTLCWLWPINSLTFGCVLFLFLSFLLIRFQFENQEKKTGENGENGEKDHKDAKIVWKNRRERAEIKSHNKVSSTYESEIWANWKIQTSGQTSYFYLFWLKLICTLFIFVYFNFSSLSVSVCFACLLMEMNFCFCYWY